MKSLMTLALGFMFLIGMAGALVAGSIDAPGAPTAGSGMQTLQQIYNYLNSGIKATPVPNFQEPGAAPGSTMKTTKEIYDDIVALYERCNATAADVMPGKTFFCTQSGSWGVQTGNYATPTPTPTPTITPTPVGDTVTIGTLVVAAWGEGPGCASNVQMVPAAALSWAAGLVWLGASDWRLPTGNTGGELSTICENRALLGSYHLDYYWSATKNTSSSYWALQFGNPCSVEYRNTVQAHFVRAVRP